MTDKPIKSVPKKPMPVFVSVGAPIVALMVAVTIGLLALLADVAREQDRSFTEKTTVLVDRAIQGRSQSLATLVIDNTNWDPAYQAVTLAWDSAWVEENLFVTAVDAAFIFRPSLGVRYSSVSEAVKASKNGFEKLFANPEVEEAVINLLAQPTSNSDLGRATVRNIDGQLALFYFAPFRPTGLSQDPALQPNTAIRKDVGVYIDLLTGPKLDAIARSINVNGFRYIASIKRPEFGANTLLMPVLDLDGGTVGWLAWDNEMPGSKSFVERSLVISLGLVCLFAGAFFISSRLVRAQVRVLNQARKTAEAATQVKSDFLSNMSHELRTPLNAVIGYSEIIEEEVEFGNTAAVIQDAGRIKRSATHLLTLINDILDHSKIEAGKMGINPEVVNLKELVADVADSLQGPAANNNVALKVVCDPDMGEALIDPVRLRQCLLNLTSNAVKFTKDGSVTLAMRPVMVGNVPSFRISVTDTGIGIKPEAVSRLFTPFEQADGSTTRNFGGTGLGLSITKHLTEAMGGEVKIESEYGKGSVFTLIFPLNSPLATTENNTYVQQSAAA